MDGVNIWRRAGSALLMAFILGALGVQLIALGWLGSRLFENLVTGNDTPLIRTVVTCIAIASGAGILLMGYIIAFHEASGRRDQAHEAEVQIWMERWVEVIFSGASLDSDPDSRGAEEALVRLAGQLEGIEYLRTATLLEAHGIIDRLLADLGSARLARRLEAIELLSLARPPRGFPYLVTSMADRSADIRIRAARAAARILAVMPPGSGRDRQSEAFALALADHGFSSGVVEEMLLLAGKAADASVRSLLHDSRRPQIAVAALNAGGRLNVSFLYEHALTATSHDNAEIRAAAFRCLARMGPARKNVVALVRRGMADPVWFVRVHAARAAVCAGHWELDADLWDLLGDPAWWVRRAAAETFVSSGPGGRHKLLTAVTDHADRFARDMAAQVAKEHGLGTTSAPLRETA